MTPYTPRRAALVALASVSLLGACGDDDDDDASGSAATTGAAAGTTEAAAGTTESAAASDLAIDDVWARTSPGMATAGAAYLTITNEGDVDDALLGASVDPSVAATTELHETVIVPSDTSMDEVSASTSMGGMSDDSAMDGMMTMQPIDRLPVPAGGSAVLEPGGNHLMLMDLAEPLKAGDTIEITLEFEVAGDVVVTAEIRDEA